jgi:hypothetical protein
MCPERIELGAQSRHPPRIQAVVLKSSISSADHQASLGEHPEMLGYCRTAGGEVAGQLGHCLFAVSQQLQQPPAVRFGYCGYQIRHLDTLVPANVSRKPPIDGIIDLS